MTGAIADCERVLDSFWGQPVNTVTTLAFVVAGLIVAVRSDRGWVATALIATGFGSFVFHGPMPAWGDWAHDVSLVWLLVVAGFSGTQFERPTGWPALIVLAIVIGTTPWAADPLGVLAAGYAIFAILWRSRSRRVVGAVGLLAVGAVVGRLSATGGPWCNPDTLLQGHAFWHLASATAVTLWATAEPRFYDQNGADSATQST
ncbi:hypothetical protein BH23ACT5_BH23ACT5_04890 [soil metagenome]